MVKSTDPIKQLRIEPQTGAGFRILKGQVLRVIDREGQQVVDLFCTAAGDIEEVLSSGHTTDYNSKLFLSKGDILYSNRSNPMFRIVKDKVGRHIMLYAPCSQRMFEKCYGVTEQHPNCLDNLVANLTGFGVKANQITVPFNIFMHIRISKEGAIQIQTPRSKAGDYVDLRAEMDMFVGVAACAAGICNNFSWTAVDIEIYDGRDKND